MRNSVILLHIFHNKSMLSSVPNSFFSHALISWFGRSNLCSWEGPSEVEGFVVHLCFHLCLFQLSVVLYFYCIQKFLYVVHVFKISLYKHFPIPFPYYAMFLLHMLIMLLCYDSIYAFPFHLSVCSIWVHRVSFVRRDLG